MLDNLIDFSSKHTDPKRRNTEHSKGMYNAIVVHDDQQNNQ